MGWGNRIVAGIAALAALGLLAISAGISFRFGSSFGRSELDGWLYGGASALGDVLKAVAVFLVASAVKRRRLGPFVALGALGGDRPIDPAKPRPGPRGIRTKSDLKVSTPKLRIVAQMPASPEFASLITSFLNLHTQSDGGSFAEAGDLYRTFAGYCEVRRVPIPSQRRFGEELTQRGYLKDRRAPGGRVRYLGIEMVKVQAVAA